MAESETIYWLLLEMIFGAANIRLHDMRKLYSSARELYLDLHDPDCALLNEKERRKIRQIPKSQAEGILAYCEKTGIRVMTCDDEIYPDSLRHIYNPPSVLFYRGDVSLLNREALVTVVGARNASEYSHRVTDYLCRDMARRNMIVVSGCAVGIDAISHWSAINEGKPTIGVLGCGLDYDYPRENREMKERIVQNGLLLSEYFPGTQPYPANFPVRNRILSGISEATLVIEASERSGSLITANLAVEQGKYVFCVPPQDIFNPRYRGVVRFLRDGAIPVFDPMDIMDTLYRSYPHKLVLYDEEENSRTEDSLIFNREESKKKPKKKAVQKSSSSEEETSEKAEVTLPEAATPEQKKILELLKKGGQNVNAICCILEMSFEQTSMLLMEMEMEGWIQNTERDIFALTS